METIYKIDLDLKSFDETIDLLKERLSFLNVVDLLPKKYITKIELIYKTKYSAKIHYSKVAKDKANNIIITQAILGDDYKRLAITYRDYLLGIKHYNRLFDIKRYPNGEYKESKTIDVTDIILDEIN